MTRIRDKSGVQSEGRIMGRVSAAAGWCMGVAREDAAAYSDGVDADVGENDGSRRGE